MTQRLALIAWVFSSAQSRVSRRVSLDCRQLGLPRHPHTPERYSSSAHLYPAGFITAATLLIAVRLRQGTIQPIPFTKARTLRSEEHTSELQSLRHLVCRLLLEK